MHGVVVTAYRDFPQLANVLAALEDAKVHLHVDQKAEFSTDQWEYLRRLPGVDVVSAHNVGWGAIAHLHAIIDGVESILRDDSVELVHVISGQDYLSRPLSEYENVRDPSLAYLSVTEVTDQPTLLHRFRTRFEFPGHDLRDPEVWAADQQSIAEHTAAGKLRETLGTMPKLFKGMIWCSLPADMARYCVEVARTDEAFMDDLHHTRIPEEFFFPTVLMNSPFSERVSRTSSHFMVWTKGRARNSGPAVLEEQDLNDILASGKVFLRKVTTEESSDLVAALAQRIGARIVPPTAWERSPAGSGLRALVRRFRRG